MKHSDLRAKALSNPEVKAAYDDMQAEFAVLRQMLEARQKAGLNQADVAKLMGTKAPAVSRLEASLATGKRSPSLTTLKKYARAVGCELQVNFVPH
jgi:transcriptional regulator with XRE-family HTH domain